MDGKANGPQALLVMAFGIFPFWLYACKIAERGVEHCSYWTDCTCHEPCYVRVRSRYRAKATRGARRGAKA